MAQDEILVSEQVLQVPYVYSAGPVASKFLIALRDEKKILGLKCSSCGKVMVPPRATCGSCSGRAEEWVETGPGGELVNFTVVHYKEPVHPLAAPFTLGLVKLDNADSAMAHLVLAEPDEIKIGMRVKPVFADERKGTILDLKGFAPE